MTTVRHLPLGKFVSATERVDCWAISAINVLSGIKQSSLIFRWRALDICSIYSTTLEPKHCSYTTISCNKYFDALTFSLKQKWNVTKIMF